MPKAKPYPDGEEEERTTIESQWEEEASTTVEQGEVAEQVRSLGLEGQKRRSNTNVTHTGAVDEPTVDDQHAHPHLSTITPLRADQNARLSITAGNDTGQTFEIRPGKTYTIGRAIDNDVVLTDIAVSRKHFDLRHEDGAWVIVDRGSGNGTVVNGNIEDNPFMLANGDAIEIGNTIFRFEQEKGPVRPQQTMELGEDDEEMSTVAGKPLRADVGEVEPAPTPVAPPRQQRPKTLPPPTPLRPVGHSQPPPLGLPPAPASTLPLPQMANRAPAAPAGAPTMLGGDPMQQRPLPGIAPMTLPGPPPPQRPGPMYPSYPQATEIPPHSVHAMLQIQTTQNRRGDVSTAHVQPMPYDQMLAMVPPQRYTQPQLSSRAKYFLAAAGLSVLAAIATIAIVKSGDDKSKTNVAQSSGSGNATAPTKKKSTTTVEAIKTEPEAKHEPSPTQEPPKQEPKKQEAKQEAPKQELPKQEPPKQEPLKEEPKKQEPQKVVTLEPRQEPKQDPPKQEPKQDPPKQEPKKQESKKQESKKVEARTDKKRDKTATTTASKKVASADPSAARSKADDLYKKAKFNDASSVLLAAAKSADDDEARDLTRTANYYSRLGKSLNSANAPATDPVIAFDGLRNAQNYDQQVGAYYANEIKNKLAIIAPKAAYRHIANKNYQAARTAVITAQSAGASADSVSIVNQKLESVARDLYQSAQQDGFDSANGKDKLKQIKLIVDAKSTWYQKATKALGG